MITITLYAFSKKLNSTAIPANNGIEYNCIIKETSSIINPVISFNLGIASAPSGSNYAYIPSFSRYYFITEWTYQNALWVASLTVDVLATYKSQIGTSNCYITRSSSAYNGAIMDTTYPVTANTTFHESEMSTPWTTGIISGNFVVGIGGRNTTYYLFSYAYLQLFFDALFSDDYCDALYGEGWLTAYPQLKSQTNPLQYITSLIWIPNNYTGGEVVESVKVGWVDIVTVARKVEGDGTIDGSVEWSLIRHPQATSRGNYLNNSPFSYYTMFFPPFGTIQLDADVCANSSSISAIWSVDLRTGSGTLKVVSGSNHVMSWLHSQVGVPYQVSQVVNRGYGWSQAISAIPNAISSAVNGNISGIVGVGANEIGTFANSKVPSARTIGNNGGGNSLKGNPSIIYEFKEIVSEDIIHRGRPLCENRQINTLSGYIKTSNAYINCSATQKEKEMLLNYMEGGFYYE